MRVSGSVTASSVAPTIMGMYGHTSDDYEVRSSYMTENLGSATQTGIGELEH